MFTHVYTSLITLLSLKSAVFPPFLGSPLPHDKMHNLHELFWNLNQSEDLSKKLFPGLVIVLFAAFLAPVLLILHRFFILNAHLNHFILSLYIEFLYISSFISFIIAYLDSFPRCLSFSLSSDFSMARPATAFCTCGIQFATSPREILLLLRQGLKPQIKKWRIEV